jgi:WD40 repeat protein
VSPDGSVVAIGGQAAVHLVESATLSSVAPAIPVGTDRVIDIGFVPDGQSIVVSYFTVNEMSVVSVPDRRQLATRAVGESGTVWGFDIHPDGNSVVATDGFSLTRLELPSLEQRDEAIPFDHAVGGDVAFSEDGGLLAVGSAEPHITLVDPASLEQHGPLLRLEAGRVGELTFLNDDAVLAATGDDGSLTMWSVDDASVVKELRGHTTSSGVVLLPGGRLLTHDATSVAEWAPVEQRTAIGRVVHAHADPGPALVAAVDDERLAIAGHDGQLRIVNREGQALTEPVDLGHQESSALAVSPNGAFLAVGVLERRDEGFDIVAGHVELYDANSGERVWTISVPEVVVLGLAFDPAGRRLAIGTTDGKMLVADVASGAEAFPLQTVEDTARVLAAVTWSDDGHTLYTGGQDGIVRLWDTATWEVTHESTVSADWAIIGIELLDSERLAVSTEEGLIRFVDVSSGEITDNLGTGGTQLQQIDASEDERALVAGSRDGALRLWELSTGRSIGPAMQAHDAPTQSVTFLGDGTAAATSAFDGRVIVWDLDTASWQEQACAMVGRNLTREEWNRYLPAESYRATCPQWPTDD